MPNQLSFDNNLTRLDYDEKTTRIILFKQYSIGQNCISIKNNKNKRNYSETPREKRQQIRKGM